MSLGSALTSSAKFSSSLDQLFFLQPLCARCSILGFLIIPAATRSFWYCSLSLEMPMRYLLRALSSPCLMVIIRCLGSTFGQTGLSASLRMMQSEVLLSLPPVPLASPNSSNQSTSWVRSGHLFRWVSRNGATAQSCKRLVWPRHRVSYN